VSDGGGRALYIELPQPGEDVEIPTTAKVSTNASVTLRRGAARRDGMVQNGVNLCPSTLPDLGFYAFSSPDIQWIGPL